MGSLKYCHLATLALNLLTIPASNPCTTSKVRSSLATETVSSLITCHFNNMSQCCENVKFNEALLSNAKKCTRERNLCQQVMIIHKCVLYHLFACKFVFGKNAETDAKILISKLVYTDINACGLEALI